METPGLLGVPRSWLVWISVIAYERSHEVAQSHLDLTEKHTRELGATNENFLVIESL